MIGFAHVLGTRKGKVQSQSSDSEGGKNSKN